MIVYVLKESYFDGCDSWESIVDIYLNKDDAVYAQLELEAEEKKLKEEYRDRSWFIHSMETK